MSRFWAEGARGHSLTLIKASLFVDELYHSWSNLLLCSVSLPHSSWSCDYDLRRSGPHHRYYHWQRRFQICQYVESRRAEDRGGLDPRVHHAAVDQLCWLHNITLCFPSPVFACQNHESETAHDHFLALCEQRIDFIAQYLPSGGGMGGLWRLLSQSRGLLLRLRWRSNVDQQRYAQCVSSNGIPAPLMESLSFQRQHHGIGRGLYHGQATVLGHVVRSVWSSGTD